MSYSGFGTDVHFFTDNPARRLVLGGFPVAGHRGVEADSDGDIVLHAICNALSSAIGGKSMGFYVSDLCKEGVHDSDRYVALLYEKITALNYIVNNVSIAVECITPRIDPLIDAMKANIARLLALEPSRIGITATQGDRNEDRIRVYAVVTLDAKL